MSQMFLNIVSTFKNDGIAAATRQLGAFGAQAGGLGSTLGKVGATLASFGLAAKAVQFTTTSIDSARDLERNMYSLNTVFGNMAPQMEKFTQEAYKIGLSQKDAAKASVFLGSVLKQSGFSMEDVTEQSQKLVSLGVDLAATYGYDVQEALLGMTALFRGEYDPIEKFGVAMKQSEINAELAARKLDHLTGAERRNAEQVIRMELLYQRAADATGAFSGQSGNLFVEQKKLQAQFENMQAAVGQQLLPVMGALVEALVPLVDEILPRLKQMVQDSLPALEGFTNLIKDMSDDTTTTGQTVGFLADSFGQLFGFIARNFGVLVQVSALILGVSTAVNVLTTALNFLKNHPIIFSASVLVSSFIIAEDRVRRLKVAIDEVAPSLDKGQRDVVAYADSYAFLSPIINGFKGLITIILTATGHLDQFNKLVAASAKFQINTKAHMEMERRNNGMPGVFSAPSFIPPSIAGFSTGGGGGGKSKAQQAAEEAQRKEQELLDKRQKSFESFNDAVKNLFGSIKDSIMSSFTLPNLGNSVNAITRNIGKLLEKTRVFARNIKTLADQGLNATLLQQVIGAGPIEGAKLAQALVGGGSGFLDQLNQAYGEFGGLAGSIAGIGTERAFATAQTVNNYSIEVTGGIATSAEVGRSVVNAIKDFERQSGTAWRG